MCEDKRDTYFIVGTVLKHKKWVILGYFGHPSKFRGFG